MAALLPLVLAALEVRRTLLESGAGVLDSSHGAHTRCPTCGGRLLLRVDELVCTQPTCGFGAGNVLDYFTALEGGDVEAALERLHERHGEVLDQLNEFPWGVLREQLAAEVAARRAVLEFFFSRRAPDTPALACAQTAAWLRSAGVDVRACPRTVYVLTREELAELLRRVARAVDEPPASLPAGDAFAVTPLLRSFSQVAMLAVRHRAQARVTHLAVQPARVMFSGVWELGGVLEGAHVCEGAGPAVAYTTHSRQFGLGRPCLGLHYSAGADESWKLGRLTYLLQTDETLAEPARLYGAVDELAVAPYLLQPLVEPARPFEIAYADRVAALCPVGVEPSREFARFVHAATIPYRIRSRVVEELRRRGLETAAALLHGSGSTGGVYQIRNVTITATPEGYLVRRKRDVQPVRLTNFTLQFEHNVRFEDCDEIHHHAHILFKGQRYPVLLSRATLHSPRDLESAVHAAFLRLTKSTTNLPAIFDKPMAAPLPVLFNLLLEPLHTIDGHSRLGWVRAPDEFSAPGVSISSLGVHYGPFVPHPDKPVLKLFSPLGPPDLALPDPREDATRLCALVAHFLVRLAMGRPVFPAVYRDTPVSRLFLQAAFRSIGQLQPVVLNGNDRGTGALDGVAGWPVLASGLPAGSESRFFAPLVLLQDRGLPCSEVDTAQAPWLWRAVHGVACWIARLAPAQMPELYSDGDDAFEEGFRLLRLAMPGVPWMRTPVAHPRLWEALRKTALSTLGTWLAHDFARQQVRCDLKAAPVRELEAELDGLGATFDGRFARVPSVEFLGLLGEFYGHAPTLPPVPPESTSETASQEAPKRGATAAP